MREALNILGYGPCHHMVEIQTNEEQKRLWRELANGATADWEKLFAGYRSCVDWPSAYYWRELVARYPAARVILTYRSPESWWKSFESTILRSIRDDADPESLGISLIARQVFCGEPHNREKAIEFYNANVEAVQKTIPADRLLVYNLGDGWAPLCSHLGVEIPGQPYPKRNTTDQFRERLLK
jgi:hypothetical protein